MPSFSQEKGSKETASSKSSRDLHGKRGTCIRRTRLLLRLRRLSILLCSRGLRSALARSRATAAAAAAIIRSVGEKLAAAGIRDGLRVLVLVVVGAVLDTADEEAAAERGAGARGEGIARLVAVTLGGDGRPSDAVLDAGRPLVAVLGGGEGRGHKGH